MAVRYSGARLEAAVNIKRVCFGALRHLLQHRPEATLDDLGAVQVHVPRIAEFAQGHSWGVRSTAVRDTQPELPSPELDEKDPEDPTSSSDDSESSAASEITSLNEENVRWLLPNRKHSNLHISANQDDSECLVPLCKKTALSAGSHRGQGITRARIQEARWCALCRVRAGPQYDRLFEDVEIPPADEDERLYREADANE